MIKTGPGKSSLECGERPGVDANHANFPALIGSRLGKFSWESDMGRFLVLGYAAAQRAVSNKGTNLQKIAHAVQRTQ